jgi:glycosyltransferase involved in cell wall biosynthesis
MASRSFPPLILNVRKRPDIDSSEARGFDRPEVSVIVATRNRRSDIVGLLDCLDDQTCPSERFEVVISDDGSEEDIASVVLERQDDRIRVLRGPPRNAYAALNRAAHAARGHVLAICDSDCQPEPAWIEAGIAALGEADVIGGRIKYILPERPTVWTYVTMETFLDHESSIQGGKLLGGNVFVRASLFRELGGFDDSVPSGADSDFGRRCHQQGKRVSYCPTAVVGHPTMNDFRSFRRKVWRVFRASAIRKTKAGRPPRYMLQFFLTPGLGTLRWRRTRGLSPWLDRKKLRALGASPSLWDCVAAIPVIYVVLPAVGAAACLSGVWQADRRYFLPRRLRRTFAKDTSHTDHEHRNRRIADAN